MEKYNMFQTTNQLTTEVITTRFPSACRSCGPPVGQRGERPVHPPVGSENLRARKGLQIQQFDPAFLKTMVV